METYRDDARRILIQAASIEIGEGATFGRDIDVRVKGRFRLGARSRLGDDVVIRGHDVLLGDDLFHSSGLHAGGGGAHHPEADLTIGDRCTIHDNDINLAKPVVLGDDVGLSNGVAIVTHGFWLSALDGYPAKHAGVTIEDGAILGLRAIVLMGAHIGARSVVGAGGVVTGRLEPDAVYAGNPAKLVRRIQRPTEEERRKKLDHILEEYRGVAKYHGIAPRIRAEYPLVHVNGCTFDVEKGTYRGVEDDETDDFRDYVRKWGLRYYSPRGFRSVWTW